MIIRLPVICARACCDRAIVRLVSCHDTARSESGHAAALTRWLQFHVHEELPGRGHQAGVAFESPP